jgi:hypothetical protein
MTSRFDHDRGVDHRVANIRGLVRRQAASQGCGEPRIGQSRGGGVATSMVSGRRPGGHRTTKLVECSITPLRLRISRR